MTENHREHKQWAKCLLEMTKWCDSHCKPACWLMKVTINYTDCICFIWRQNIIRSDSWYILFLYHVIVFLQSSNKHNFLYIIYSFKTSVHFPAAVYEWFFELGSTADSNVQSHLLQCLLLGCIKRQDTRDLLAFCIILCSSEATVFSNRSTGGFKYALLHQSISYHSKGKKKKDIFTAQLLLFLLEQTSYHCWLWI